MYQIAVIGSAVSKPGDSDWEVAVKLGLELAKRKVNLLTGACAGTPMAAVLGSKQLSGFNTGFSPAFNSIDHKLNYGEVENNAPIELFDTMIYCGNGYLGRSLSLIYSADAVIMVGGRLGTVEEMTIAIHEKKPLAIYDNDAGVVDVISDTLAQSGYDLSNTFFDNNIIRMVDRIIEEITRSSEKILT